jgi:hypothetical protein
MVEPGPKRVKSWVGHSAQSASHGTEESPADGPNLNPGPATGAPRREDLTSFNGGPAVPKEVRAC